MAFQNLHILFCPTGADHLRAALTRLGRDDRVIALPDDLSFGPIDPPDPALRAAWVKTELRHNWARTSREAASFWEAALVGKGRRIVWISRRSSREQAGFLEFVWRLGDTPCEVIDVSQIARGRPGREEDASKPAAACGTADVQPERIIEAGLLDRSRPLGIAMRAEARQHWAALRRDNASLRVVDADLVLRSAPISAFDEELLSHVIDRWRKSARVISEAFQRFWSVGRQETGDTVLTARLQALVDSGRIEGVGDLSRIRFSEVRLPPVAS